MHVQAPDVSTARGRRLVVPAGVVLTVLMVLFPPFTSLRGTEYAFLLGGPVWSRKMGEMGAELGLTPRLHWILLAVQVAILWLFVLVARRMVNPSNPSTFHPPNPHGDSS